MAVDACPHHYDRVFGSLALLEAVPRSVEHVEQSPIGSEEAPAAKPQRSTCARRDGVAFTKTRLPMGRAASLLSDDML